MQKRVILHIGMPKTGTTSLQRAFKSGAKLLGSRGIAYATEGLQGGIAHHDLIEAVRQRNTALVDRYFEQARPFHEDAEQILISSEAMCRLRDEELLWWRDCLRRHFGNPDFMVWMFVRRLSSLTASRWHAHLRIGGLKNLPAFAFEAIDRVLHTNRLPFEGTFDRYAEVFSPACISVVPIEVLAAGGKLVSGAFNRMFGIDSAQLNELPRLNVALEPGSAELLRALAMRRTQEDADSVGKFVWGLIPLLRKGDNVLSDFARMFTPFVENLVIEDRSEAFLLMERKVVARLADRLEGWDDGTVFGPADPAPVPYVRDDYWFSENIRQRLDQAYSVATGLPDRTTGQRRIRRLRA